MQQIDAGAVLAIWTDAAADSEAEFNEWYNRQHVNERCDVPGFLSGRRYRALSGRPRYLALYDTTGSDVLSNAAYRNRLDNPTDWTRRVMPGFRNMTRAVLDIEARIGRGYGGTAATLRPRPGRPAPPALVDWLIGTAMPRLVEQPGMTGAQLLVARQDRAATDTTEGQLRTETDSTVDWAFVAEGAEAVQVRTAMRTVLSPGALRAHVAGTVYRGLYRLLYGVDSLRADETSA